jgi:hypothetical protein
MTKKCSDCKFATPYEHNYPWNEKFQQAYDEEEAWNKALDEDKSYWFTYKPFPRCFWANIKAEYEREEIKKANYIICKCMPTYAERKMDDYCGQFEA